MRERAKQREDMKSNEWPTVAVRLTVCTCVRAFTLVSLWSKIMYKHTVMSRKRFLNEVYGENLRIVHKLVWVNFIQPSFLYSQCTAKTHFPNKRVSLMVPETNLEPIPMSLPKMRKNLHPDRPVLLWNIVLFSPSTFYKWQLQHKIWSKFKWYKTKTNQNPDGRYTIPIFDISPEIKSLVVVEFLNIMNY